MGHLSYCKTINLPLFTPETLKAKNEEDLWQNVATVERYKAYKGKSSFGTKQSAFASMIDHYYDKLLRLGLFETNNSYLQKVKQERIGIMVKVVMDFASLGKVDHY